MPCMAGLRKHPWQWSEQRTHTWRNPLSRLVFGDSWTSTNNPFFSVYRGAALGPTLAISLRKAFVEHIAASHIERINHILILGMSPLHSLMWMLFMAEKLGKQRALCSSVLLWLHYCLNNLIYSQPGCACKSSGPGRDLLFRQHSSFQEYFILQAGLPGFEPLWNPLFLRRRRENPIFSMHLVNQNTI